MRKPININNLVQKKRKKMIFRSEKREEKEKENFANLQKKKINKNNK